MASIQPLESGPGAQADSARPSADDEAQLLRREADRIDEITRAIATQRALDASLQTVVAAALDLAAADHATVWLIDEAGGIGIACSLGANAPRSTLHVDMPNALIREWTERPRVAEVHTAGRGPDQPLRSLVPLLPGASNLVAPILTEARLVGGLAVGHSKIRRYDADETRLIERLALYAALALQSAGLREQLDGLSLVDADTGLANRRRFDLFLDKEFAAARRGRRLALLRVDVDAPGPRPDSADAAPTPDALRTLAGILRVQTRAMNLAARIDARAFAVVLSDADRRAAFTHARRVAAAMRDEAGLSDAHVRARFGIATFHARMRSPADLLDAADHDLASRSEDSGARLSI